MAKAPEQTTVLIVEDHMAMRKIIRTVVQSIGIRTMHEAADGAEALMMLKQSNLDVVVNPSLEQANEKIDLVICDWSMPRKSGLDVLRGVRANQRLANLPFLMLTAEGSRENILQAVEAGVDDYVVKPFTAAVLEQKIRALLLKC